MFKTIQKEKERNSLVKTVGRGLSIGLALSCAFAQAQSDVTGNNSKKVSERARIDGVAVTGFNRLLGQPVWDLGAPFGGFGINFVFGYNPNGTEPIDLTSDSPMNTLVASGNDDFLAQTLPVPDAVYLNVPLRDVAIIVAQDGTRAPVPMVQDAAGNEPSKSFPNGDITLGKWLSAKGTLNIRCFADGTSNIRLRFKNLIPNGVYTMWGLFGYDFNADGVYDTAIPQALGGVPNTLVAEINGKGSIDRFLNFCPTDLGEDLITVNIAYHSDGNVYGGVPELGEIGLPGGTITHDQINFGINVAGEIN